MKVTGWNRSRDGVADLFGKSLGLALLGALFLTGCGTPAHTPSKVDGLTLRNPTLGFKGISMTVPSSYEHTALTLSQDAKPQTMMEAAWLVSANHDTHAGVQTLERVAFQSRYSDRGMVLSMLRLAWNVPSPAQGFNHDWFMSLMAEAIRFPHKGIVTREVRKIGANHVAVASRQLVEGDLFYTTYLVPVPPKSVLVISGLCRLKRKDYLTREMEEAVATITVE